jgi:hypothetical protein
MKGCWNAKCSRCVCHSGQVSKVTLAESFRLTPALYPSSWRSQEQSVLGIGEVPEIAVAQEGASRGMHTDLQILISLIGTERAYLCEKS